MQLKSLVLASIASYLVRADYIPYGTSLKTCTQPGVLAITFDDGPSRDYTNSVLDTLKKKGVKATFFLVGENFAGNEAIIQRQVAEGHVLASHSFNHPYFQKLNLQETAEQITKTESEFARVVGFKPLYFRFPYGDFNETTLQILGQHQYKTVYWTLDSLDASVANYPIEKIMNNYHATLDPASFASSNFVALNHDLVANTNTALNNILDYISSKGYRFVTVPECLGDSYSPYRDTIIDYSCKLIASNCGDHCPNNCGKQPPVTTQTPNPASSPKLEDPKERSGASALILSSALCAIALALNFVF